MNAAEDAFVFAPGCALKEWIERGADPATVGYTKPAGLCGEYVALAEQCTDAPWHYHEAAFWTIMGSAAGRAVRAVVGPQDVFANLYTCLVGQSSITRKSTSVIIAHRLAKMLGVALLPSEVTPEKLFEILSEAPRGILVCPEFSGLLAMARKKYGSGLMEMFLQLYDCPDQMTRQTKGGGEQVILKPFVAMLTASTPDMLRVSFVGTDMTGGLVPRFVLATRLERREPLAVQPPLDNDALETIAVKALVAFPEAGSDATLALTEGAGKRFAEAGVLLENFFQALLPNVGTAMGERMKLVAVKVGLLAAVLAGRKAITPADIDEGVGFVLRVIAGHGTLKRMLAVDGQMSEMMVKVELAIKQAGSISRRKLLRRFIPTLTAATLTRITGTLKEAGLIEEAVGSSTGGRKPTIYLWRGPDE